MESAHLGSERNDARSVYVRTFCCCVALMKARIDFRYTNRHDYITRRSQCAGGELHISTSAWLFTFSLPSILVMSVHSSTNDVRPVRSRMSYGLGVVVVGDSAVGKTCLIQTYGKGVYPDEYVGTVGHSYTTSLVINGEVIEVNVHDTGGSSQHSAVRQQLYMKADVVVICFDLTERKSFLHINQFWLNEMKRMRGGDIPFLIVGCKNDIRNPNNSYHVQKKEGLELARELGCRYFECSSITQRNVKDIFDTSVKVAMDLEPRYMRSGSGCGAWLDSCFAGSRHHKT